MEETLKVAYRAMQVSGQMLDFPENWNELTTQHIGNGAMKSMGMVRFYLLALKGAGYINLRLGNTDEGISILEKVIAMDTNDRLGATFLLDVAKQHMIDDRRSKMRVVG
jgi:hypothetical protein